jgi:hypothetical protein
MARAGAGATTSFQRLVDLRAGLDGIADLPPFTYEAVTQPLSRTPSLVSMPSPNLSAEDSPTIPPLTPGTPPGLREWAMLSLTPSAYHTQPPLTPREAQFRAEIAWLLAEGLTRLRHCIRRVESEWRGFAQGVLASEGKEMDGESWRVLLGEFEGWVGAAKGRTGEMEGRVRRMGRGED